MSSASALRQPGFSWLWSGQTVSMLGSQVTVVALPLTAVLTLHASAGQVGLLRALQFLPFVLFGLLVGAWVDRRSRLGVLMLSNLGQGLLLAVIPLAAVTGHLSLPLLAIVVFLFGTLNVLLDVSFQALFASLLPGESLAGGNSLVETSRSTALVVGPGLGGVAVQLFGAPLAIAADAFSFLACAFVLRAIRDPESRDRPPRQTSFAREVWDGLEALLGHPVLRAIAVGTTLVNLTVSLETSVVFLYLVRTLHFSSVLVGLTVSASGVGGIAGAIAGGRSSSRLPVQLIVGLGLFVCGAGLLLTASAVGPLLLVMAIGGLTLFGFGVPFFNVNSTSLRQSVTPARLQGRVAASSRTLSYGAIPIGAILGGQLGEHLGLRQTIAISGVGILASALVIYLGVLIASRPPPQPSPARGGGS